MQNNYRNIINDALKNLYSTKSLSSALFVCNTLLEYMGTETKSVEDIELSKFKLPNAERYDRWFDAHPHFRGDRACFELISQNDIIEAKFYALNKRSKLFIAGSVNFTPNFEDRDYTRNDPNMKVGIDFFFTPEKDSIIVVLSNRGNLRLVELKERLTSTQDEIFTLWHNVLQNADKNILHTTIWESFKLSSLNKKFYEGIANSFTTLTQHLQKNNIEEQLANQFANRLHGRLLFLWFLRKKNIINESKEYFTIGDKNDTEYYANTLSTLFFNVLNNEDHKDFDSITPYLNGGLFDQKSDGLYWNTNKPTFPIGFFRSLYDHFDCFNFTTDESTPEYEQIAIDPEMLGRVFESFLATLTTETGAQAKKANGAFYTPREIVSYMSRESLRQYLYTALDANMTLKSSIDELLDRTDNEWALAGTNSKRDTVAKEDREHILEALRKIKVLDPAVGSGAFPMGILHKILSIFERLDPNFDSYVTKLSILKDNIYGTDIDPTAIEICHLRAWLSIIVDVKDIKKIKPLPNLDFKFVCANSLISLASSDQSAFEYDPDLKTKLISIRNDYYATSSKIEKGKLQKKYIQLTHKDSLFDDEEPRQLKSYQPFENGKSAEFYDPELMHGVERFDVVIGNPPYVFARNGKNKGLSKNEKKYFYTNFELAKYQINLYALFLEKGKNMTKESGILSYIIPNNWLTINTNKDLREFILNFSDIKIVNFYAKVFESASVDSSILIFSKTDRNKRVSLFEFDDSKEMEFIKEVPNDYFRNKKDSIINISSLKNNEIGGLMEKIENGFYLNKIADVKAGLQAYEVGKGNPIQTEDMKKNRIYHNEKKIDDTFYKYLDGRDVQRYFLGWSGEYLKYGNNLASPRKFSLFSTPRILVRQIPSHPPYSINACFVEETILNDRNSMNIVNIKDNPFFILSILNSKLITFWFIHKFGKLQRGIFPQFKINELEQFPIPECTESNKENLAVICKSLIKTKEVNSKDNTKDIEDQIDELVYKLYGLNDDEIKVIEDSLK